MKHLSFLGLSLATLLASLAVPVGLQTLPDGTVTLDTSKAIATSSLVDTSGQIGPEHEKTLSSGRTMRMALHSFWGRSGQTVTIALTSQDFDTIAVLYDSTTAEVLVNHHDPNSNNATVQVTLPTSGPYLVGVTSTRSQPAGNYRLVVTDRN